MTQETSSKWWVEIVTATKTWIGLFALIVLVINAILLGLITAGKVETIVLIFGFALFMLLIVAFVVETYLKSKKFEANNKKPKANKNYGGFEEQNWAMDTKTLRIILKEHKFEPDVIVGVPRGGLIIAALLSKAFESEPSIPVLSLWPHRSYDKPDTSYDNQYDNRYNNPYNKLDWDQNEFAKLTKILVVDDICRSGETLSDAKKYLKHQIRSSNPVIKTAAINFYDRLYAHPIPPDFPPVHRPQEKVKDATGEED